MDEHYHYTYFLDEPIIVWEKPNGYKNVTTTEIKGVKSKKA